MKIFYLSILLLLLLFVQSCGKENSSCCDPQKFNYFTITETARKQTPYFTNPAFDTLSFVSHEEDTVIFVKTKTDSSWYCEYASGNPDNNTQNCYQILHNTYKTIRGVGNFDITHSLRSGNNLGDNLVKFNLNNSQFLVYDYWIGNKNYTTFKDEFVLNNRTYNKVITIYSIPEDSNSNQVYINKEFGIFYFNNKSGSSTWQLIK